MLFQFRLQTSKTHFKNLDISVVLLFPACECVSCSAEMCVLLHLLLLGYLAKH